MKTKKKLGPISSQFVSQDKTVNVPYQIGNCLASSLSGFLAGVIITCLAWLLVIEAFFR